MASYYAYARSTYDTNALVEDKSVSAAVLGDKFRPTNTNTIPSHRSTFCPRVLCVKGYKKNAKTNYCEILVG